VNLALAWESPIDGAVSIDFAASVTAHTPVTLTLQHSSPLTELATVTVKPGEPQADSVEHIKVKKGDRIYFVAASPADASALVLEKIAITVVTKRNRTQCQR
jgi:hypothetical protein